MNDNFRKWFWAICYVLSILLANIFVNTFGIVKVFNLVFPAGAIFIGLCFSLRDFAQKYWNHKVWYFILLSGVITLFMNWKLAVASVTSFLISEGVDWLIYTVYKKPLHKRIWLSNLFSTPLDSLLFVSIAFGWIWPAIIGQAIVKYISSLIVIPFLLYYSKTAENSNKLEYATNTIFNKKHENE